MNETDKQELSEETLTKWRGLVPDRHGIMSAALQSRVNALIDALRAVRLQAGKTYSQVDAETRDELQAARERITELERQLVNSKWLRHELNVYYLDYPTSKEEVLEYKKVCTMSDVNFLALIKAQDFKEKQRLAGYRGLIKAISPFVSCSICGSPAEYIETENCWRHRGPVDKYYTQTFCDKYGYPINLQFDHAYALIEGGYVQIEPSERIKFLEQQSQRKRITELEQQLAQAKIEIGGRDLVINSARMGEQHNRERIEELENLLAELLSNSLVHTERCKVFYQPTEECTCIIGKDAKRVRAALAKKEEKDV